ncbi:MAG TPA: AfsR/SARP family transcriptional regulator, partial [Nocardioidaceae bacterium]|nr:AfsR/SARP family transcriptional regulator [Nocardioidaceae bacterium]
MPGTDQPDATVLVRVLGALTLAVDGEERPFPSGRPGRLLADLLLARGRVVGVSRLAEDVWGDEPPEDPRAALHTTVARVRRALGPAGALVSWRSPGYVVDLSRVRLDSEEFLDRAARAREQRDLTVAATGFAEALALWRGPAWGELAQDLAQGEARRLEDARLAVCEDRAAALLDAGRWAEATGDLRVLVAEHPLRERAVGLLMRCLHRSGDVGEALAAYAAHRDLLADELGLDPTPELEALHQQVLRRDVPVEQVVRPKEPEGQVARPQVQAEQRARPVGASEPAAPVAAGPRLHGREAHLAALRAMLAQHRCVTVVGPGGVGKTSVARSLAGEGPSSWWVDLASVQTPEGVVPSVARAMQVEVYP